MLPWLSYFPNSYCVYNIYLYIRLTFCVVTYTEHTCTCIDIIFKQDIHHSSYVFLYVCTQTSVDSVEALVKKHTDFESTSVAHEERTKALSDQANRLIHAGHYATTRYCQHYAASYVMLQSGSHALVYLIY